MSCGGSLTRARFRSQLPVFIGHIHGYCNDTRCSVREVQIVVKEDDDETPSKLHCPACRGALLIHDVFTRAEQIDVDRRDARISVNIQLWERAHPGAVAKPISICMDDNLPTTGPTA